MSNDNFVATAEKTVYLEDLEKFKNIVLSSKRDADINTMAKIVTADYMCDLKNIDNPKYKGLYKWWSRTKERYRL